MDRALAHEYCDATKVRDRNAPLSQLIDTTNYDLVLLGDALGDIGGKISALATSVPASTK
jgi:hypothetical protein